MRGDTDVVIVGHGDLHELTADVAEVINGLRSQLTQSNVALGKAFRQMITHLLIDPDTPLWQVHAGSHGACITIPKNIKEDM